MGYKDYFGDDFDPEKAKQIFNNGFVLDKDYSTICDKCKLKTQVKGNFCPVCQVDIKGKTLKAGVAEKAGL